MFIIRFLNNLFYVLDEMMNPSTQVLGREDKINIRCPVPLQALGVTQRIVFPSRLEYIFCQYIVGAIGKISDYKLKKISASTLRIFFLFYAFNGLQFIFPAEKGDVKNIIVNQATKIDDWCLVAFNFNKLSVLVIYLHVDSLNRVARRFQDQFTNEVTILLMRFGLLDDFKKLYRRSFEENFVLGPICNMFPLKYRFSQSQKEEILITIK